MRHLVIPDCQIRPGDDLEFLRRIGTYIVEKQPEVIINIGDFADMASLSSYDQGKKTFEGRRYKADIEVVHRAMDTLLEPLHIYNVKQRRTKHQQYHPRMVFTLGNHCDRINRAVNNDPKLDGTIGISDLKYEQYGWEVYPYLQPVILDDIAYCHYFVTGVMGRPCSSAQMQLNKHHMSVVSGHQQGLQIATGHKADGSRLTSIIAGSCLAPYHKVLTADLRYVPLEQVKVGDKLVSFDEHLGMSAKRGRRYKTGTVLNTRLSKGETFYVTLSSGKIFETTKDHRWLTNNCMGVLKWQETQKLRKGINGTKISRLFDEWESSPHYDTGWLAGMYDGEGSLYTRKTTGGFCTQLSISQSETHNPDLCQKLVDLHKELDFTLSASRAGEGKTTSWRITGGQAEIARFLGTVRPSRMLRKFQPELLGNLTSQNPKEIEYVVSIESAGTREYVEIEIDAKTMIVDGYPHHNCYEHNEDYLGPQGNKHWRGILMLHEVNNGSFDLSPISLSFLAKKYG